MFATANSNTVYMTTDALYVATAQDSYSDFGSSTDTRIDRFTVNGTEVGWQASGLVTGTLINQFAMDEQEGYLVVATHNWSSQFAGGPGPPSTPAGCTCWTPPGTLSTWWAA